MEVAGDSVIFIEHQSQSTGHDQADENETTYYEVDLADVRAIYEDVLSEETDYGADFEQIMKELAGVYREVEEPGDFNLPHLNLENQATFKVETAGEQKDFALDDLLADFMDGNEDQIVYNILYVSEDAFRVDFDLIRKHPDKSDYVTVFFLQDLADTFHFKSLDDGLIAALKAGVPDMFTDLFTYGDDDEQYIVVDGYSKLLINRESNKRAEVFEPDMLSANRKFVYINGEDSSTIEDRQQVQKVGDYLANNENYLVDFDLDWDQVVKIAKSGEDKESIGRAGAVYVDEHIAVLSFEYPHFVGSSKGPNVIIDLKSDPHDPDIYFIDFGVDRKVK